MLADQTKVSPWINADPSVNFPASASRRWSEGTGGGGREKPEFRSEDNNVTRSGAPSLHKTRETSVGLDELQHLFLHKLPLYIH